MDSCSKRAFADWWKTTAADQFIKVPTSVLDHRRFWDAMHAVTLDELANIEHRLALRMIEVFDLDISALALDMTNFATYLDSTNPKAPIAQRGKAKQKRSDLRLVGLGLVVTRDGGVPLISHAYPGNRPDVTQFATMIDLLVARYTAVATAGPEGATATVTSTPQMTVVFDAGQNFSRQLRPLGRRRAGIRRLSAALRLPGPARPSRHRPQHRRHRPVRRPDRAGYPPRGLRRRPPRGAHPLTLHTAPSPAGSTRP